MTKSRIITIIGLILCAQSVAFRIQEVPSPVPTLGSDYGISSATDGRTMVVGAPGENSNAGAVYIFEYDGLEWSYVTRLEPNSVNPANEYFGYSVDVDGDIIVVGAKGYNSNQGAIYVFEKDLTNGWDVDPIRFIASDGHISDYFGQAVAIDGNTIVAGAYNAADDDSNRHNDYNYDKEKGAAYVYEYSNGNWSFTIKLIDPDGESRGEGSTTWGDQFGRSVSIDGDIIVIGSWYDDWAPYTLPGSACVFRRVEGLWDIASKVKLVSSTQQTQAYFGLTVAVSGNVIAIGSPYYVNGSGISGGRVSVFRWNDVQWIEEKTLIAPDYANGAYFGERLSLEGDRIVVGEYHSSNWTGSAYLFEWDGETWSDGTSLVTGGSGDRLGSSVAICDDVVFVGAYRVDTGGVVDAGMIYALTACNYDLAGDLNDDCKVDLKDFAILSETWLTDCITDTANINCISKQ